VATLEPRKNLDSLIKAYLKINTNQKLVLVGDKGWKNGNLERLIENHKDKILSLGYVPEEDLPSLYQEALCLVYPSFYEGFGLPILEAMSCGIPVVVSNTSSMPEVGGKAAIYINPESVDSIVKAIEKLLGSPELVKKYQKLSIEQSKKFSWEKSAVKLIKCYRSLEISR
jgi:glycosyltransferase involved in cell wall biosynthesis